MVGADSELDRNSPEAFQVTWKIRLYSLHKGGAVLISQHLLCLPSRFYLRTVLKLLCRPYLWDFHEPECSILLEIILFGSFGDNQVFKIP